VKLAIYLILIGVVVCYIGWSINYCAGKKLVDMTGLDAQICLPRGR
jgi:hypothetical protein